MESDKLFFSQGTDVKSFMSKYSQFADLLRKWYLYQLLHSSPTAETRNNVMKCGSF